MMGMSTNPEVDKVTSLLTLLADPAATKERLEAYNVAKTMHDEAMYAAASAKAALETLKQETEAAFAKREDELKAKDAGLVAISATLQVDINTHTQNVAAAELKLAQREEALKVKQNEQDLAAAAKATEQRDRDSQLDARAANLRDQEAAMARSEADLRARQEDAEKIHALAIRLHNEHSAKLAKLRAIASEDDMRDRADTEAKAGA